MSKENISSLNKKLVDNEHARVILEQKIKENQTLLQELHEQFEKDLETLKDLQDTEDSLRKEISNQQKEDFNDTLSLESMRKIWGKAIPLFSKIKSSTVNKAKDVKNYIDATTDKKWIEEKYKEYKAIALKKGDDIKSREEFQKIALSVKNVQGEIQELNLYDIINKLSTDAGHAGKAIKKAVKNIKIEEKVEAIIKKKEVAEDDTGNKLDIFTEWASHKFVNLEDTTDNLYNNYLEYLSKKHPDLDINTISYSKKSGSFTKALNKYKKSI